MDKKQHHVKNSVLYTPEEYETLKLRCKESECHNLNEYIRSVSLEKLIVKFSPDIQKRILMLMSNISNNMNQIAIRVNENRNIYDIDELKEKVDELCQLQVFILSELRKLKHQHTSQILKNREREVCNRVLLQYSSFRSFKRFFRSTFSRNGEESAAFKTYHYQF